jgi:hypothetical protein
MLHDRKFLLFAFAASLMFCREASAAPAVWSGLGYTFTKTSGADPTLPQNQDRITNHVAITRGDMAGLYNIVLESFYDKVARTAPADTEWATDINNPAQTIAAANHQSLQFTTWSAAYGDHVGLTIVDRDAVAHLITDDVYIDFRVTNWAGSETGGVFTYLRAPAPAASGDFNHDGFVNAADYTVWRDSLGHTVPVGTAADGNINGTIDVGDYEVWRSHFGQPASGAASVAVAPELDGRMLAILGILSIVVFRPTMKTRAFK